MSRQIKFNLEGVVLEAPINKIDRAKLYGTSTREVFDENGEKMYIIRFIFRICDPP